jgi:tRNA pseudouridine55 synthase
VGLVRKAPASGSDTPERSIARFGVLVLSSSRHPPERVPVEHDEGTKPSCVSGSRADLRWGRRVAGVPAYSTRREIEECLPEFRGELEQQPPPFSAIKVQGRKAYELARAGDDPELAPRTVTISRLELRSYQAPDLALRVECSAGTYIRSLAHDLGEKLGTGAHLAGLRRTRAGPFRLEQATPWPMLEVGMMTDKWERFVLPATEALPDLAAVVVPPQSVEAIRFGHPIPTASPAVGMAKAVDDDGELIAILEAVDGGSMWHPRKVFLG